MFSQWKLTFRESETHCGIFESLIIRTTLQRHRAPSADSFDQFAGSFDLSERPIFEATPDNDKDADKRHDSEIDRA